MKKLIITTDTLKPALAKLSQAVNSKPTLPVLANILFKVTAGKAQLITTDLELTIFYDVVCESKEDFDFMLPFDFLSKITTLNKHCPLTIDAAVKSVKITGPNDVYDVKLSDKIDIFPKLPELPKKSTIDLDKDILNSLHIAASTTSKNELRPALQHVLLDLKPGSLTIASTDGGYVVYSKQFKNQQQETEEILLSQKVIKALEGYSDVRLFYHDKAFAFQTDNITIFSTKSTHKYVDFRTVFPQDWPANLKLNKYHLLEALDKCSLVNDQLKQANLNLENDASFELSAKDEMLNVNVKLEGSYSGKVKQTAVNSEKLLKLLNQIEEDEISFAVHDSQRAIIITTADEGYRGLIMPIANK